MHHRYFTELVVSGRLSTRKRARVALRALKVTHRVPRSTVQRHPSLEGSWCCRQIPESHQVVSRDREGEHPFHPLQPSMPQLSQPADRLQPAEDLFHTLALVLTDQVPRMARGAFVNGTASMRIVRSEERRVGKECRSRWSPYH